MDQTNLDKIVERLLTIAEEQEGIKRGKTTLQEQWTRRKEIFLIRRLLGDLGSHGMNVSDHLRFIEAYLKLENFMVGVPEGTTVIPMGLIKQHHYVDKRTEEIRLYFCPHFETRDNDSLSIVAAFTPPSYHQPFHAHYYTAENTLSVRDGLVAAYKVGRDVQEVSIPKGMIAHSKKGLAHSLGNSGKQGYALNISVKVPESVEDRFVVGDKTYHPIEGEIKIIEPEQDSTPSFKRLFHNLEDRGYHYTVSLLEFFGVKSYTFKPSDRPDVYFVTDGDFWVKTHRRKMAAPLHSLLVIDPGDRANLTPINPNVPNTVYCVTMTAAPSRK